MWCYLIFIYQVRRTCRLSSTFLRFIFGSALNCAIYVVDRYRIKSSEPLVKTWKVVAGFFASLTTLTWFFLLPLHFHFCVVKINYWFVIGDYVHRYYSLKCTFSVFINRRKEGGGIQFDSDMYEPISILLERGISVLVLFKFEKIVSL